MPSLAARVQDAVGAAFRIERELTAGGMSRLFLAEEISLKRRVVIKVLPPEVASDVSAVRFRRESEVTAHLQHPHILPVLTAGAEDDLLYYVMPYVPGESLRHRLTREGRLPLDDAIRILAEVADALAYAHAEGVVHRDVKPENILLQGGHAVLADFGISRALIEARRGAQLTDTGVAIGTPAYMAPEQAAAERDVDARADVYALGAVGYEVLTGAPPFTEPTAQALIAAHLTKRPRPVTELRRDAPAAVAAAIMLALAKDPQQRLRTAAEFRDAMRLHVPRAPAGRWQRLRRLGAAATVGTAALAAVLFLRPRAAAPLDPDLLAVAPFDVFAPAPGLELWREGVVDLLSRRLDGAGPLRTVSPTFVIRRWTGRADPASAAALGRRSGAGHVVVGAVVGTGGGDSVRLTGAVVSARTGTALADFDLIGAADRMDQVIDSLALAVLRVLSRAQSPGARFGSLGSRSLPALKEFLRGEQLYRRGNWDSARVHYDRAVDHDDRFAVALRRSAQVRWWGSTVPAPSWEYLLRAGAHNRGLAPRDSLLVTADSIVAAISTAGGVPGPLQRRLFATLEEGARRYPDDSEMWFTLGDARLHWGNYPVRLTAELALAAFARAVALDSTFGPTYEHVAALALYVGDTAAARRYMSAHAALPPAPDHAAALELVRGLLDPQTARTRAVQRLLDTLPGDALWQAALMLEFYVDSAETAIRAARALAAVRHGFRLVDSTARGGILPLALAFRGHLREAHGTLDPNAENPWERGVVVELVLLDAVPPESAAAIFQQWLRTDDQRVGAAPLWWARRGDTLSIRALAGRARARAAARGSEAERACWRYTAAAAAAYLPLARRDTTEALRQLAALPDSLCPTWYTERLIRATLLEAGGHDQEAAALLATPLHEPQIRVPSDVTWALLRGRVNERLRRSASAVIAYRFVLDVWRNPDPELQPLVAEARTGLERLGSGAGRR